MAERQPTISASQMDAMACRLKWHWGYRRGYQARKKNINLVLGTGIHEALEAYYIGKMPEVNEDIDPVPVFEEWADDEIEKLDAKWTDEIQALEDARELGVHMLQGYVEYAEANDDFIVLETEQTISRPIPDPKTGEDSPYLFVARLDGIVRDNRTGKIFSLEHKTLSRFDPDWLERDNQMTAQVWLGQKVVQELDLPHEEEIVGVIYNGLRKQKPTSRTKSPLYERHKVYRTQHEIDVLMHRAYNLAHTFHNDPEIYPSPQAMACSWCDFRAPCLEYARGGGYQQMLNELFTSREERYAAQG